MTSAPLHKDVAEGARGRGGESFLFVVKMCWAISMYEAASVEIGKLLQVSLASQLSRQQQWQTHGVGGEKLEQEASIALKQPASAQSF